MDKYEYKIRADEIKDLIAQGEYIQAAEIADTIDWRRVKSVMMLCTISDLYKINRRYEDAKNMLLLAYERRPGGRTICYSLCELCIKTEEFVQAVNYYKEYVQAAPKDSGRFILQYKLYEAQDVSLEERISVLEELKKRDYREKWAYELAYLYHRVGLATRCVEECDELILWFGDGKYVIKAMELKMLHQPLSPAQQERYDHRFSDYEQPAQDSAYVEEQAVEDSQDYPDGQNYVSGAQNAAPAPDAGILQADTIIYENIRRSPEGQLQQSRSVPPKPAEPPEELDIQVKIMDVGQYNTIDMQAEQAALVREVMGAEWDRSEEITRSIIAPMMDTETLDPPQIEDEDINEDDVDNGVETIESTEVFFGETGEITNLQPVKDLEEMLKKAQAAGPAAPPQFQVMSDQVLPELMDKIPASPLPVEKKPEYAEVTEVTLPKAEIPSAAESLENLPSDEPREVDTAEAVMEQLRKESIVKAEEQVRIAQPPKELAKVLSQEPDGQLSLVIPERETVEKQITGQLSIQDILTEWERMKKEGEERRKEEVRQRVLQQTGEMFTEFDASVRDGLLEQLENGTVEGEPAQEQAVPGDAVSDTEKTAGEMQGEAVISGDESGNQTEAVSREEPEDDVLAAQTEEGSGSAVSEEDFETPGEYGTGEVEEPEKIPDDQPEKADEGDITAPAEEEPAAEGVDARKGAARKKAVSAPVERERVKVRPLTREEKELFGPYIQSKSAREQLVRAIDNISLASYTGNVIITGAEGMDTYTLAKNLIREVQLTDGNFSGRVARISGQALNSKDVTATLQDLGNGALIIQKASGMSRETAADLNRQLQGESLGIIVVMEDTRKGINKLLEENGELDSSFTARIEVQAPSNDTLVAFAWKYAKEMEYSIDDLGVLALHTRIEELQTIDHAVTVMEVKEIVDDAIRHANRKTIGHFVDILLAKRYDEEDMIILTEKDFV